MYTKSILYSALRTALTGKMSGLPIEYIIALLGRDKTLKRINKCIEIYGPDKAFESNMEEKGTGSGSIDGHFKNQCKN